MSNLLLVRRWCIQCLIAATLFLSLVPGCGPSTEDMMMQAAKRARVESDDDEEEEDSTPAPVSRPNANAAKPTATPQPNPATSAPKSEPATSAQTPAVAASPGGDQATTPAAGETVAPAATAGLPAMIAERRPAEPLDETARAMRSAENLKKIGQAFVAYTEEKKVLPDQAIRTSAGMATLSWRVELLPYLGYQELYDQFNRKQPWDSPANIALLERIPDCYVSPERFDSNTNYVGFIDKNYLFNTGPVPVRKVEDGLDNTLVVIEVNDAFAVPWTAPLDYVPENGKETAPIGGLRPDGTFALWGNGWPTLLKNGIKDLTLHNALTYESQDGLVAATIHNSIRFPAPGAAGGVVAASATPTANAAAASDATTTSLSSPATSTVNRDGNGARPGAVANNRRRAPIERLGMPTRAALAKAKESVEKLYDPRIKAAKQLRDYTQLADEMVAAAENMTADPAGAYALLDEAIEVFAITGQLDQLLKTVDLQVMMFEVDAITANTDAMELFAKKNSAAMAAKVDSRAFMRRLVPVAFSAIESDQYEGLLEVLPAAVQFEGQSGNRAFLADLNRLRQQTTAARNHYRQLSNALGTLRGDAEDPRANSIVGRYVSFIKGDWQTGLPLLVKGDNARLSEMARLDLATGNSADSMLKTADSWWELAEATSNELFGGACRQRASHWYEMAMAQLPESLEKMHAKARYEEASGASAGTPLSILESLAKGMGMTVETEVARLKEPGIRLVNNFDDEDD